MERWLGKEVYEQPSWQLKLDLPGPNYFHPNTRLAKPGFPEKVTLA